MRLVDTTMETLYFKRFRMEVDLREGAPRPFALPPEYGLVKWSLDLLDIDHYAAWLEGRVNSVERLRFWQ